MPTQSLSFFLLEGQGSDSSLLQQRKSNLVYLTIIMTNSSSIVVSTHSVNWHHFSVRAVASELTSVVDFCSTALWRHIFVLSFFNWRNCKKERHPSNFPLPASFLNHQWPFVLLWSDKKSPCLLFLLLNFSSTSFVSLPAAYALISRFIFHVEARSSISQTVKMTYFRLQRAEMSTIQPIPSGSGTKTL